MIFLQQIFPPWHIALDMFLIGVGLFIFYKSTLPNEIRKHIVLMCIIFIPNYYKIKN